MQLHSNVDTDVQDFLQAERVSDATPAPQRTKRHSYLMDIFRNHDQDIADSEALPTKYENFIQALRASGGDWKANTNRST